MVPDADTRADYNCNGATTVFAVPWYFLEDSHLRVLLTTVADETYVPLTLNADYTVAGAGNELGGSITTAATYSNAYRISVIPDIPFDQTTELENGDKLPAASLERMVDKTVMLARQLKEMMGRAVRGSENSSAVYQLPPPVVGSALGWVTSSELGNVPNNAVGLAADLANTGTATKGAGMVGFSDALAYAAGTVGKALQDILFDIDARLATVYTTTGTAPNFTASSDTVESNAAGQRITVKWSARASDPVTLNVNGFGAMTVRRVATSGSLQNTPVIVGVVTELISDGTYWVVLNDNTAKNGGPTVNFTASCTGASANISMSCDRLTVRSIAGVYHGLTDASGTLNTAASGVNGLDTGTLAANTWYYMFFIYNPSTNTTSTLCSLSATFPTLPAGYTHFKVMDAFRTDGTANKYPLAMLWDDTGADYQLSASGNLTALPTIGSGTWGSWTALSVSNVVPPTAKRIKILHGTQLAGGYSAVAPNSSYTITAVAATTAPSMVNEAGGTGTNNQSVEMRLESTNIYAIANGVTIVLARGWVKQNR